MMALKYRVFQNEILFLSGFSRLLAKLGIGVVLLLVFPTMSSAQQTSTTRRALTPIRKIDKYIIPPSRQRIIRNPNIRYRYPIKNLDRHIQQVRAYKARQSALRQQRLRQGNSQQYQRFQRKRTDLQTYRQQYLQKRIAEKNKPPVEEEQAVEDPQLQAKQERKALNIEILEGRKDPTVQEDPNYLKFIEEKTRLTKRN